MRTIAIVNQKGGCGKTTVSINLAAALAELGQKTLLLDMDSQSHCAVGLAVPEEHIEQSIYDVLKSQCRDEPINVSEILWQVTDNLELAPGSIDLSAFEQQMAGVAERETTLKKTLESASGDFDYCIVDCPPAVGLLTFNALRAADDCIVPVETGYFALHGLSKQLETLSILCKKCNHHVNVSVLASMYDIRTKMAREILAELKNHFGQKMFKTIINFNTKLKEAASLGQPISEYDPASRGRSDFLALAQELLKYQSHHQRKQMVNSLSGQLEAISASAEQLLKTAEPKLQASNGSRKKSSIGETVIPQASTEQKLSDYYGVNQIDDAVAFVTLYPRAKSVQIAGDFNNWQPEKTQMEKVGTSGIWQTKLKLPQGKHRYRLVVDGQWQQDPYNEKLETNPFGGFNSIVQVK